MSVTDCRFFSGYKPCGRNDRCDESCPSLDRPQLRLLIIHLGAMGAVVRATTLLAALKRKYPSSHITWVTEAPMQHLLVGNSRIDRVLTLSLQDQLVLSALEFDLAFVLDKSLVAAGVLAKTRADLVYGFTADSRTGAILPCNEAARELWELGLDNHRKFFINRKTEIQLQHEALELPYNPRDEYDLPLMLSEEIEIKNRHQLWSLDPTQPVIGFNTGCGPLMPAKKWSVEFHRQMIQMLAAKGFRNLVLLGGPEDAARNDRIAKDLPVIKSCVDQGVRDGLQSIAACDLIFTGDSFGMHLAIAMKKFVIAWFGPSCAHEIELFGRGEKILTQLSCAPCWKRSCSQEQMCFDHVDPEQLLGAFDKGINWWKSLTAPQPPLQTQNHP